MNINLMELYENEPLILSEEEILDYLLEMGFEKNENSDYLDNFLVSSDNKIKYSINIVPHFFSQQDKFKVAS